MGEKMLKQAIHKTFGVIKESFQNWIAINEECKISIAALCNMLEQFECCINISVIDIPFHLKCPDIKDKLQCKIMEELEEKISHLQPKLDGFKDIHSKVSQQYHNVMNTYQKYNKNQLNIDIMTRSNPLYPSLSQMIEYIDDIERALYQQYHCKRFILDEMLFSDTITSDNLITEWNSQDQIITDIINDSLCYVSYFLEEKIS